MLTEIKVRTVRYIPLGEIRKNVPDLTDKLKEELERNIERVIHNYGILRFGMESLTAFDILYEVFQKGSLSELNELKGLKDYLESLGDDVLIVYDPMYDTE